MATDKKREAKLMARRIRDKRARDHLDESYIRRLIKKGKSNMGSNTRIPQVYITIRKLYLAIRRMIWGRSTPEMNAAFDSFSEKHKQDIESKAKRKV